MDFSRLTDPQAYKDALAGLLRRGTEVGEYIQEAPTKVGQSILDAGQRQSALMNKAFDPTGNTLIRDPQAANQAAMNLFEGPMSFAPAGITAFHGTPHLIQGKFDINKVGTGEGAQAYGHGMYFAENPAVAKGYADMDTQMAKTFLATNNDDIFKAINDAEKQYDFVKQNFAPSPQTIERNKRTLDYLNNKMLKNQDIAGNLYKVDIPDA
jgi:hypothetical protein